MESNYSIGWFQWFFHSSTTCYLTKNPFKKNAYGTPLHRIFQFLKRLRKCPQFCPTMFFPEKGEEIRQRRVLSALGNAPVQTSVFFSLRRRISCGFIRRACTVRDSLSSDDVVAYIELTLRREHLHCKPVRTQKPW